MRREAEERERQRLEDEARQRQEQEKQRQLQQQLVTTIVFKASFNYKSMSFSHFVWCRYVYGQVRIEWWFCSDCKSARLLTSRRRYSSASTPSNSVLAPCRRRMYSSHSYRSSTSNSTCSKCISSRCLLSNSTSPRPSSRKQVRTDLLCTGITWYCF